MKKNAALFGVAALMLFSLTGCLTERQESVDSGKNVRLTYDEYAYCENGYYYRFPNTGQIFFYDLSSAQAVPLCNKPECEHTEQEQDTCNSYIRGIESGIQYYNDKLYFLVSSDNELALYRQDPDGNNREKAAVLSSAFQSSHAFSSVLVDRSNVFVLLPQLSGDDVIFNLYTKKLTDDQELQLLYEGQHVAEFIYLPQYYNGNYYFNTSYYAYVEDELISYGNLYQYNPDENNVELFLEGSVDHFVLWGNTGFCSSNHGALTTINMDTKETRLLLQKDEYNRFFDLSIDKDYFYIDNSRSCMILNPEGYQAREIQIYQHDGTLADTIKGPETGYECINFSGDIPCLVRCTGAGILEVLDKSQIGTGSYRWETIRIVSYE